MSQPYMLLFLKWLVFIKNCDNVDLLAKDYVTVLCLNVNASKVEKFVLLCMNA
jgi:hypothetical protein